jgi:hypothetical protein
MPMNVLGGIGRHRHPADGIALDFEYVVMRSHGTLQIGTPASHGDSSHWKVKGNLTDFSGARARFASAGNCMFRGMSQGSNESLGRARMQITVGLRISFPLESLQPNG